jgi:hypothetical protein
MLPASRLSDCSELHRGLPADACPKGSWKQLSLCSHVRAESQRIGKRLLEL